MQMMLVIMLCDYYALAQSNDVLSSEGHDTKAQSLGLTKQQIYLLTLFLLMKKL